MKRKVFYSFHYKPDNWRAAQVRNIGIVDGNQPAADNDWEKVKKGGDEAIKRWIADQMRGRSCTVVLVGTSTVGRKWIKYEIKKSWDDNKGLVGIHIHGLKDANEKESNRGRNPFTDFTVGSDGTKLSSIVKCYTPTGRNSRERYDWIKKHLSTAVEEAIAIRKKH